MYLYRVSSSCEKVLALWIIMTLKARSQWEIIFVQNVETKDTLQQEDELKIEDPNL